VRDLKIAPGKHSIGLKTPDGRMHTVDITVKPGEQGRIIRRFVDARMGSPSR